MNPREDRPTKTLAPNPKPVREPLDPLNYPSPLWLSSLGYNDPATSHLFPTSKPPQAKVSCPSSLAKEFRSLKHPSVSTLLSIHPSQTPSTRAHAQSRHSLHSSQSSHPASVLHAVPSLSLPWQHQAQRATSQLGEEREGRGEEAKAGERTTRLPPSFWNHHPRMKGKWAGLEGPGGWSCQVMVQAGGSSPGGAGKPLRSRPMISLTVMEGQ